MANAPFAHAKNEQAEAVAAALHVLVCPAEEGGYLAQGIEIDYTATGSTEEEAREHFAQGFTRTVMAYLDLKRPLDGLLKIRTPAEFVTKYWAGTNRPELCCLVTRRRVDVPADAPVPHELAFLSSFRQATA